MIENNQEVIFPINQICIEGPDCSGKTSLYKGIHERTNFRWNIHDRSYLSAVCYAVQYGRDEEHRREGFVREMLNLNNKVILLVPPEEVLVERLKFRGDDYQNLTSIKVLRNIFAREAEKLKNFPNVLVIEEALQPEDLIVKCVEWLRTLENVSPIKAGRSVRDIVRALDDDATAEIRLVCDKNSDFSSVLSHPREGHYYEEIQKQVDSIISDEIAGKNPYGVPQGLNSRRFYYSSNSCLSSIHFLVKKETLKVLATLRSTDVERNASIDLKFLCHLSNHVANRYNLPVKKVDLTCKFNCAHLRKDLPEWQKNEELE